MCEKKKKCTKLTAQPFSICVYLGKSLSSCEPICKIARITATTGFPGSSAGKESACWCKRHRRCGFDPWVGKFPWRRAWQPNPVFLPGEFHGQRSLAGYYPWVYKKVRHEVTEHARTHTRHNNNNFGKIGWCQGTEVTKEWKRSQHTAWDLSKHLISNQQVDGKPSDTVRFFCPSC